VAKKCKIEQTKRIAKLVDQHAEKRAALMATISNPETSQDERLACYRKLRRIPRDASKTRYRNRCELTGRPRGYLRKFRMCRVVFRDLAHEAKLPGVTKSSW
jgi:small subunit ribosomal protein S14